MSGLDDISHLFLIKGFLLVARRENQSLYTLSKKINSNNSYIFLTLHITYAGPELHTFSDFISFLNEPYR